VGGQVKQASDETAGPGECRVELYGSAQLLAGRRAVAVAVAPGMTLADLVTALAERLPALAGVALDPARGAPADGFIFNRNGRDFLTDLTIEVRPGDRLLLLASVAGGAGGHERGVRPSPPRLVTRHTDGKRKDSR
jgi:molybdopterin converting factor small subunit